MKKILALTLLLGLSKFTYADSTDSIDNFLLSRAPIFTQNSPLDSDIRLRAMGGLDLPIDDESNTVGVFKYNGSPAGLPLDYLSSKAEVGIYLEGGTAEDTGSSVNAYQGDRFDEGMSALSGMAAFRFGQLERGGALALQLSGTGLVQEFENGAVSEVDREDKHGAGTLFIGYGHRLGNWLFGGSLQGISGSLKTESNAGTLADVTVSLSDLNFQAGYQFQLEGSQLTITAGPVFRTEETEAEIVGTNIDQDLDGSGFGAGIHYAAGSAFRAALKISGTKIDGDRDPDDVAGTEEDKESEVGARIYVRPNESRFSFGASIETTKEEVTGKDTAGSVDIDDENTTSNIGFGVAYHFSEDKGLLGIDFLFGDEEDTDHITSTFNEDRKTSKISLGGEYQLGAKFVGRAGMRIESLEEDNEGAGSAVVDTSLVGLTVGGEYSFSERFSLSAVLGTSSIEGDTVDSSVDELEYKGNSIEMMARMRFGNSVAN